MATSGGGAFGRRGAGEGERDGKCMPPRCRCACWGVRVLLMDGALSTWWSTRVSSPLNSRASRDQMCTTFGPKVDYERGARWEVHAAAVALCLLLTSLSGPIDPSFRALSRRLKFTVRRHTFNKDSFPLLRGLGVGVRELLNGKCMPPWWRCAGLGVRVRELLNEGFFFLENFQTSKHNQSTRVVKIDIDYTIRPFKRSPGTKVD